MLHCYWALLAIGFCFLVHGRSALLAVLLLLPLSVSDAVVSTPVSSQSETSYMGWWFQDVGAFASQASFGWLFCR